MKVLQKPLEQSRLGPVQGRLGLITWKPSAPCFIAQLPDELLAIIFEVCASDERGTADCLALTLVCRRWRWLSEPFLYRTLDLHQRASLFPGHIRRECHARVSKLMKNFRRRPHLQTYVRELDLTMDSHSPSLCRMLDSIVLRCPNIRKITLDTQLSKLENLIIGAVNKLTRLESLHLAASWCLYDDTLRGLTIRTILAFSSIQTLKELILENIDD
ncbi:MAG: hypothetical protein M1820_005807 [Bogoriella megaspora]|nr:MAG: hypothetical protein M1820_005807 [Bogoriella megaspora]